jgi:prophage regulatory protein
MVESLMVEQIFDSFVPYSALRSHGIFYTRVHLNRLMKAGTFPAAVQLSPNRVAWRLSEIESWKTSRPPARNAA